MKVSLLETKLSISSVSRLLRFNDLEATELIKTRLDPLSGPDYHRI